MWESYDQPGRKPRKKKRRQSVKLRGKQRLNRKKKKAQARAKEAKRRKAAHQGIFIYYDPITVVVGLLGDGLSYYRDSGE